MSFVGIELIIYRLLYDTLQFLTNHLVDCVTPTGKVLQPTFHCGISPSTNDYIFASSNLASCAISHSANPHFTQLTSLQNELSVFFYIFVSTLPTSNSLQTNWDLVKSGVTRFIKHFSHQISPSLSTLEAQLQKILALWAGRQWPKHGETSAGFLKRTIATCQSKKLITSLYHPVTDYLCTESDSMSEVAAAFYETLCSFEPITSVAFSLNTVCQGASQSLNASSSGSDGLSYKIL
ncbi:hypothetical protein PHYBLDRAFT_151255 [Phycomyces blakesleeanus NRRL 1555(-)]|uniref:Uncharacterized protein n=1 Tax=Phycomyces blakesleeanus (strain ATCC 8743b / DSM 1359 / FGSC 10004 / NBRC 33097 / NRRL 1555) TaxID=763407 RepID=A0A162N245_PHYB8|nr:hypothetical protein PHYBLDRAFT_151255 [Phycomyces blakesleeanus NRRL 1555(-)]OAD67728.1 hypothetical protein PHYBLDRAFT_151255 [Phycomyces blakesleeanus NRRL 1555(-)]|eukprot:XP_018285768.1 hypothetical protein PHYBLDRAFT_151255 [Phycomyces blakesleeanus NRRL 1555(-)]